MSEKQANRRRSIPICIRLSPKEYSVLERKLKKANMSRTDYLIRILLDKEIRVCDFRGDIKAIVYELQKIGVNLNQIARNLNSGIFQDAYGNVQRMTVEHAKICKKFLDFMDEVEIREIQGG